jgi:hypothetical protein
MGTSTEEREYRREYAPDLVSIPLAETSEFKPFPGEAAPFTRRFALLSERKFRRDGKF